jgi:threonine dehydrogenase-like Zn-dependent dehydrogenase
MFRIPDEIGDDKAILLSDIFPTGYFGAELAEIKPGDTVAVFGCGPVGQFAIAGARLLGASRILAVDDVPDRLETARRQGAECIDFNEEDPVEAIRRLTGGIGCDRAIDAVGVDAEAPSRGPARERADKEEGRFKQEVDELAPQTHPSGFNWQPGDAPSLVLEWAVDVLAKAGTLSIIGVYPETARTFPIGKAMMKNLTLKMGNCNHRKYVPKLMDMVRTGQFDPLTILPREEPFTSVLHAYKAFDTHRPGWMKVQLDVGRFGFERDEQQLPPMRH